jgi:hypothetical protein
MGTIFHNYKQLLQIAKEDITIVEDYLEEPLEVKEDRYFYLNRQLNLSQLWQSLDSHVLLVFLILLYQIHI